MTRDKYYEQFNMFSAKPGYTIDDEGFLFRGDGKSLHNKCNGPPNTEVERYYFEAMYFIGESSFFGHARDLSRITFRENYIYMPTIVLFIIMLISIWG
jgi:hypothetical protein